MRLFLALDVGNEAKEEIRKLAMRLRDRFPHIKVVPYSNLHITLRFIGEVDESVVDVLKERLSGKPLGKAFYVRLKGVGGFPSRFGARVVWVGLEGDLSSLSDRIDSFIEGYPIPPRDKPFVAHITVARSRRPVNVENFSVRPVSFYIDKVVLYRSILAKPNAIYRPLEYYELAST